MKKSQLKTEIRNRILEKKAKLAEAEGDENEDEESEEEEPKKTDDKVDEKDIAAFLKHINLNLNDYNGDLKSTLNHPTKLEIVKQFINFLGSVGTGRPIVQGDLMNLAKDQTTLALEEEDEIEEMSTSGGAGAYQTKYAFKLPKNYKKVNEGVIEPKEKKKA